MILYAAGSTSEVLARTFTSAYTNSDGSEDFSCQFSCFLPKTWLGMIGIVW
jgi:hypothetical protein